MNGGEGSKDDEGYPVKYSGHGTLGQDNKTQIERGIEVEREHRGTAKKIASGEIKDENELYKSIAEDHLRENPKYYDKLQKAQLENRSWTEE